MINYRVRQNESMPYIRIVLDEKVTILDDNWLCEAVITDENNAELLRKNFELDLKNNQFMGHFVSEEVSRLEPGIYNIYIITYNGADGFKDVTQRRLQVLPSKNIDVKIKSDAEVIKELNLRRARPNSNNTVNRVNNDE